MSPNLLFLCKFDIYVDSMQSVSYLFLIFCSEQITCKDKKYLTISRRRRGDYKPVFTEPKAK